MPDTLTTCTGIPREITYTPGTCRAIRTDLPDHVDAFTARSTPMRCGRSGGQVVCSNLPHGRSASACYCLEHGGTDRAMRELASDWMVAAPDSVGDAESVQQAGSEGLDSRDSIVLLRPEHSRWLAWIGAGSLMEQVANPDPALRLSLSGRPRRRAAGKRPRGLYAFYTLDAARAAALAYWKMWHEAHVASIRVRRGGTLAWGVPVELVSSPRVVVLGRHENGCHASL